MDKPRPLVLLAYRLLGWRVGPAHREWVHDDITRRGWLLRQWTPVVAAVLALGAGITAAVGGSANRLLGLIVVLTGVGLFLRAPMQERALRRQGIDASGTPFASWYGDEAERRRLNVLGSVAAVVLTVAALVLVALRSR